MKQLVDLKTYRSNLKYKKTIRSLSLDCQLGKLKCEKILGKWMIEIDTDVIIKSKD